MNSLPRTVVHLVLASFAAGATTIGAAQAGDAGVLSIRAGDREIGTETFSTGPRGEGFRITGHAVYAGGRPATDLRGTVDRGPGSELAFQLERRVGSAGSQVYAVQKRNRITVRQVGRTGERASELPGGAGTILLADSVFSLFLQIPPLATAAGTPLTAVFPEGSRRVAFTAHRDGPGDQAGITRLSGGLEGEVELGNHGEILRISLPSLGLEAIRRPR